MSENWGYLAKSQIDPSTIDEEIDSKIGDHLADPDAHLETGQSLQSHKASEIIDHIAGSIVEDKLADMSVSPRTFVSNKIHVWPGFDSLDAWHDYGIGSFGLDFACIEVDSGNDSGDEFEIYAQFSNPGINLVSGNPIFEALFSFDYNDHQECYVMVGSFDFDTFGWKIVDDKIYAMVYQGGVEHLTEIVDIDILLSHTYRIVGVNASKIEFYVDEVLIHTEEDYTLLDDYQDNLFSIKIKTTDTDYRYILLHDIRYIQDK